MSAPFLGQIKMFCGMFAPVGWNYCDGSLQSVSEYPTLFNLIGTTYGGDGVNTFGLPDLRGRVPVHMGNAQGSVFPIGQLFGSENVTLQTPQLPSHSHTPLSGGGGTEVPANAVWGSSKAGAPYAVPAGGTMQGLNQATVQPTGGGLAHDNMQPFQVVSYIIAMEGIYPSQN